MSPVLVLQGDEFIHVTGSVFDSLLYEICLEAKSQKGCVLTPRKINMEPKNHPFEKEKHLNLTSIMVFQRFQGVSEVAACLTTMRYQKKNRTAEKTDATLESSVLAEFHIVLLDHQVCHRQHH